MSLPDSFQPTAVFESYWKFAVERQRVFEKRLAGDPQPWTNDPILNAHKFTNVFRAADRVSQFLIRNVIYEPSASTDAEEVVFRILLFKLFNSIPAWEYLRDLFGSLTWKHFDATVYAQALTDAKNQGVKIWNAAYVQNQNYATHFPTKHERYLTLVNHMMSSNVTGKLQAARSYADAFKVLQSYPLHGKSFIPMQHLTDLNYSEVIDFNENDFIVAGPGALDGIRKCFGVYPTQAQAASVIQECVDGQEEFFRHFDLQTVTLFGRRLHAIDCQNLFCETDKFARVAHPQFNGERTEIKQKLKPSGPLPKPFFPPKWGLNA
jgi:alpha-glutamyl/putrescinyl thymine pyrophosphorylase clade 1